MGNLIILKYFFNSPSSWTWRGSADLPCSPLVTHRWHIAFFHLHSGHESMHIYGLGECKLTDQEEEVFRRRFRVVAALPRPIFFTQACNGDWIILGALPEREPYNTQYFCAMVFLWNGIQVVRLALMKLFLPRAAEQLFQNCHQTKYHQNKHYLII